MTSDQDQHNTDVPAECPGVSSSVAGKMSACEGCPNQKACSSGEASLEVQKLIQSVKSKYESVKQIILVMSGKGGVGKSTVAMLLARSLSHFHNAEVGFLDIDLCGPSAGRLFGIEGSIHKSSFGICPLLNDDGISVMSSEFLLNSKNDAIIWRGSKKNSLIKEFVLNVDWPATMDYLVIDTPPGTTDEHISIIQYFKEFPRVCAIVVYTSQEVALLDVRKQINFIKKGGIAIKCYVQNMSCVICPRCGDQSPLFSTSTVNKGTVSDIVPTCVLPISKDLSFCESRGMNIINFLNDDNNPLILEIKKLAQSVVDS